MNAQPGPEVIKLCCRMPLSQVFSNHAPPVMSKRRYCNICVSDKKKVKFKKIMYVYIHDILFCQPRVTVTSCFVYNC